MLQTTVGQKQKKLQVGNRIVREESMPASFEDPPPERERPPPPQQEIRDENVGTVLKIGGSGCVAAFGCSCGVILLVIPLMMLPYGFNPFSGFFIMLGLIFSVIGCYAIYYGWSAAEKGSQW